MASAAVTLKMTVAESDTLRDALRHYVQEQERVAKGDARASADAGVAALRSDARTRASRAASLLSKVEQ